jgi:hypothetical protein
LIIIRTIDRTVGLKTILIDFFGPSYTYVYFYTYKFWRKTFL